MNFKSLTLRQLSFDLINSRTISWVKSSLQVGRQVNGRRPTDDAENVFVQADLSSVDVVAQSELEVAHVAGGQLYSDGDRRPGVVLPHRHSLPILSAVLVWSRNRQVVGIATLAALSLVGFMLPSESAAEQLMIVVIGWRVESVPARLSYFANLIKYFLLEFYLQADAREGGSINRPC